MIWHIIERGAIHLLCSCFLTLAAFTALRYWRNHNRKAGVWLSGDKLHLLVVSALAVWALSTLREPFDVAAGQSTVKAVTDFISWLAGCGVAVWGLYRFSKD